MKDRSQHIPVLSEELTDRIRGLRFFVVTGLVPEEGENALYKKGGDIAIRININAGDTSKKGVYADRIKGMEAALKDDSDTRLVYGEPWNEQDMPMAYIIGDFERAFELLTKNTAINTTSIVPQLREELSKAREAKKVRDERQARRDF